MSRAETALKYFRNESESMKARIRDGIERNRKGDATVVVRAAKGTLPEEITVTAELVNHEFRFGANLFLLDEMETPEKNERYKRVFPELFNLATVPFYWNGLEPEKGKPRYAADSPKVYRRPPPDLCVDYCLAHGIEPKCHCLNYDSWIPSWLRDASVEEQKRMLEKRFREIAERYADKIPSFEVTNETLQTARSAFFYEDDFLDWSYRMADRYFPNNRLIINDYNVWFPESYNDRHAYYMQIERLFAHGITHLDSVGIQFHSFVPKAEEETLAAQRYDPEILYKLMDLYARFGIAEQITEMTIPAYSGEEEDEYVQAELIKGVYSTFFSHPAMEAVIYWNVVDGYAYGKLGDMTNKENVYYGGLLRFDMSEKPAWKTLKKLIHEEWHTSVTVPVKDGRANFRGFYGTYKLTVHAGDKTVEVPFDFSSRSNKKIEITL